MQETMSKERDAWCMQSLHEPERRGKGGGVQSVWSRSASSFWEEGDLDEHLLVKGLPLSGIKAGKSATRTPFGTPWSFGVSRSSSREVLRRLLSVTGGQMLKAGKSYGFIECSFRKTDRV